MTKDSNRIAIALIEDHEGRVLFGDRNDGKGFTNPGGHIHEGECPMKGMVRELLEETGLKPISAELVKIEYVPEKNIFIYLYKIKTEHSILTPITDGWEDPDKECDSWDFHWPNELEGRLHVPLKENILIKYWSEN